MEPSGQEYPGLLTSLQPDQAISVLDDRVALINRINGDIAEFLQERRRIEERYAADLRKLARRPISNDSEALGVFDIPWQRIVASTETLAQAHETLASKIETDVEGPLKQYGTKSREMQAITTIQGNISSIAKELAKAQEKAEKLQSRGGSRSDNASSNVDNVSREWETQSPYVFGQLQALDENRVNHLRDVLTQFQTHELDQIEKGRTSAEDCLNVLLMVETADEIKTFAMKTAQGRGVATRRRASTLDRPRGAINNLPPAPPPPRNSEARHSASGQDGLGNLPEATPDKKSKMGGLKRLGTVMRGKKGAAPPPPQGASEKKKEKSRSFAPFRRGDSSRSFQDLEETGRDLTPIPSQPDRHGSSYGVGSTDQQPPESRGSMVPPPAELNGVSAAQRSQFDQVPAPLIPSSTQAIQQTSPQLQPQTGSLASGIIPGESTSYTPSSTTTSEPPQNSYTNQVTDEPGRNLKIRDEPIREDAGEAQLAMSNMANQLRLQAQTSGMGRPQGSVRGRRDVRNTIFVQNGTDATTTLTQPTAAQPIAPLAQDTTAIPETVVTSTSPILAPSAARPSIPQLLEDQVAGSDANSIHSTTTLGAVAQHPELGDPGLNASIVETISTWFSESGITRSSIIGEVAFSHIVQPGSTLPDTERIRLRNFQTLEKVAANPTFVTRSSDASDSTEEQAGSYVVALSAIRRSAPTVGLKYQLHIDESALDQYSPILVTPAWQMLEGQASAIVLYELNPRFTFPTTTGTPNELIIKNVMISVSLDIKEPESGKASSAVMAPTQGASFRKKASCVVWRFAELKIKSEKERLLVRFMTEGGMPKKGSVELKFEIPDLTAGSLGVEKMSGSAPSESDPFADEEDPRKSGENSSGTWEDIPTKRLLMTGRCTAA